MIMDSILSTAKSLKNLTHWKLPNFANKKVEFLEFDILLQPEDVDLPNIIIFAVNTSVDVTERFCKHKTLQDQSWPSLDFNDKNLLDTAP